MYVPRPSILHRPVRPDGTKITEERAELEFQREQARINAKAGRQAATEERLVGALYATQEEKRRAWSHAQAEAAQLAAARAAALASDREREAAWLSQPATVVVDTQRPWAAVSTTYYMPPEVEAAARRRAQQEASDVNRYLAQRQALEQQAVRAAEQEAARRTLVAEDTWFNRGAANERWIAPEHRVKQRAAVPPQFAPAPPPYYCESSAYSRPSTACSSRSDGYNSTSTAVAAAAAVRRPATASTSTNTTSSRRAQEGQGVAAALRHDTVPAAVSAAASAARYASSFGGTSSIYCGGGGGGASSTYGGSSRSESVRSAVPPARSSARGSVATASVPARPQTAPAQPQRQYPWSWDT